MQRTARVFIVPGLGSSGPDHWQTYFERTHPEFVRIEQRDWETPDRHDWVATLGRALAGEDLSRVVLVAHSLGCATVAHWAAQAGRAVRGALLVAPSDVETAHYAAFPTTGFAPMPLQRLPFPSKVVASSTDDWVSPARARAFAAAWGCEFIDIGPAGHVNTASGHGRPLARRPGAAPQLATAVRKAGGGRLFRCYGKPPGHGRVYLFTSPLH